jgi:hypothetical protein
MFDLCVRLFCICVCLYVEALRRADHPSKEREKFAYELTFKLFEIIFTDLLRIDEYIKNNL